MRQEATEALVLALDEGTTGVRALAIDAAGTVRAEAYREVLPNTPAPGLVEHDPEALLRATVEVLAAALADVPADRVRAVGLATQRATGLVWEAATGRAVAPALSWQDGRTASRCEALMAEGIFVSPLAAATKIEWILDRVDPDRAGVRGGRLRCGTLSTLSDERAIPPDQVESVALREPGVLEAHNVRSRGPDDDIHLDLHILVEPHTPLSDAHALGHRVEARLRAEWPGLTDVVVHVEPALPSERARRREGGGLRAPG